MGLLQIQKNHWRNLRYWYVPLGIAIVSAAIALFGAEAHYGLRYDRFAIEGGAFWRLITGHFVHLGTQHLVLNLAGLVLVWLLVGRQYTMRQWGLVILISLVIINFGFWYLDPALEWYVGLSGLLHGLLVAGALTSYRDMPVEALVILATVSAKVIYEQMVGPMPGSESTAGGDVVVNAHLYGAIGGLLSGLIVRHSAGQR